MTENNEQIIALLTQIRDNQSEQMALQKTALDLSKLAVARQKRVVVIWYALVVLALIGSAYFCFPNIFR